MRRYRCRRRWSTMFAKKNKIAARTRQMLPDWNIVCVFTKQLREKWVIEVHIQIPSSFFLLVITIFMLCNSELREYANHCDVAKLKNELLFLTFIPVLVDCCNMHTQHPSLRRLHNSIARQKPNEQAYSNCLPHCFCCALGVCVSFSSISCRYLARVVRIVNEQNENKRFQENYCNRGNRCHKLTVQILSTSQLYQTHVHPYWWLITKWCEQKTRNHFEIIFQPMISSDRQMNRSRFRVDNTDKHLTDK